MRSILLVLTIVGLGVGAHAEPWLVQRGTSPIDDSPLVVIERLAEPALAVPEFGREAPAFGIMCRENRTDAYIHWGGGFVQNDDISVITRIDTAPADERRWGVSTNFEATFRRQPIPWIRELIGAERLYARVVPYGENPIEALFPLDGLAELLPEIAAACHWTVQAPPEPAPEPPENAASPAKAAIDPH